MTMVTDRYDDVISVDTHAKTHTYAIVTAATGQVRHIATFPADDAGTARALAWGDKRRTAAGQSRVLWVVEGASSYGAQVAAACRQAGYDLAEAADIPNNLRAVEGKSDRIDAELIARSVLGLRLRQLRRPRQPGGVRGALAVKLAARRRLARTRTITVNALTALVRTHPLGVDARRALTVAQIRTIASWRTRRHQDLATAAAREEATSLARHIGELDQQLQANHHQLRALVTASDHGDLLEHKGVGPVTAAVILSAWSHPGRIYSEAAFAKLAGASPLPASSGNTHRHRLNRTGDRQLNWALHTIIISRMAHHEQTRAYVTRKTAEGTPKRNIIRSLKRYLARSIHRQLNNPPNPLDNP